MLAICVLVPRAGGGTPYTVLTSSMEPDFPPGTLVVVRPVDAEDVAVGDVITFQLVSGRPEVATHRVIAITASPEGTPEFVTQGDANPKPDDMVVVPARCGASSGTPCRRLGRANLLVGTPGARHSRSWWPGGCSRTRGDGRSGRCGTSVGRPGPRGAARTASGPAHGGGRMRRRVAIVVAGALLALAYAGPARASGEVLVSNTDSGFAETLAQPLFDPALRWVPGDVRSATFYVQNNTADPAALSLSVIDEDAGELLDSGAWTCGSAAAAPAGPRPAGAVPDDEVRGAASRGRRRPR